MVSVTVVHSSRQGYQAISLVEALNGPGNEPPAPTLPVLSLAGGSESRPATTSAPIGGKKSSRSKRRSSQVRFSA